MLSGDYIFYVARRYDLEVDLPGVVRRLSTVFGIYRAAPYGPSLPPSAPTVRVVSLEWLYREVPGKTSPTVPMFLSVVGTHDYEARSSRPVGQAISPFRPLAPAPPMPTPTAPYASLLVALPVPPGGGHLF